MYLEDRAIIEVGDMIHIIVYEDQVEYVEEVFLNGDLFIMFGDKQYEFEIFEQEFIEKLKTDKKCFIQRVNLDSVVENKFFSLNVIQMNEGNYYE